MAEVDTFGFSALSGITSMNPTAGGRGNTKAFVDGAVTSQDLTLVANGTRTATSDGFVISISLLGSDAAANGTASTSGDTEAYFGSSALITATGNVSANAIGVNRATAKSEGGSGGVVGAGFLDSTANAEGATRAYVGAGARVAQAGNFELQALATNEAKSDTLAGTGGAFSARFAQARSTLAPTVEAYVDNDVSMTDVAGSLTIRADSLHAEGDAVAKSYGGGAVDLGEANADVVSTPTVNAYIDTGAVIEVGGAVVVEARSRAEPTGSFGDTFTPTQETIDNDTIAFASHGLADGDVVTYNPQRQRGDRHRRRRHPAAAASGVQRHRHQRGHPAARCDVRRAGREHR